MFPVKLHNVFDYVLATFLLVSPFLTGLANVGVARDVFLGAGLTLLLHSLFSDYEFAILRFLPLGLHMICDVSVGVFLVTAPWILDYRDALTLNQESIHYATGVGIFILVGLTREATEPRKQLSGTSLRLPQATGARI